MTVSLFSLLDVKLILLTARVHGGDDTVRWHWQGLFGGDVGLIGELGHTVVLLIPLTALFVNSSVTNDKIGLIRSMLPCTIVPPLQCLQRHKCDETPTCQCDPAVGVGIPTGWHTGRMGSPGSSKPTLCYLDSVTRRNWLAPWYLHIDFQCCYVVMVWPTGPMACGSWYPLHR